MRSSSVLPSAKRPPSAVEAAPPHSREPWPSAAETWKGQGGVALELVAVRSSAVADDVGDVAGVDVGVALARGELAGGCAVAAVTEPQLAGRLVGDAEGGEGGVDGAQRGGVAVGVIGGVDGGVAEAGVLGDRVAASGGGVEHRGQGGEVEADATLRVDEEGPAGDDRALDAGVRQAAHPRAGVGLGATDEARVCGEKTFLSLRAGWRPRGYLKSR